MKLNRTAIGIRTQAVSLWRIALYGEGRGRVLLDMSFSDVISDNKFDGTEKPEALLLLSEDQVFN